LRGYSAPWKQWPLARPGLSSELMCSEIVQRVAEESSVPAVGDRVESYGSRLDPRAAEVALRHAALARLMFPSLSTVADISSGRTSTPEG
jgi:hypothetical protein